MKPSLRFLQNAAKAIQPVPILKPPSLTEFQKSYFQPELPCAFPPSHFCDIPAISAWFKPHKLFPKTEKSINIEFFGDILAEKGRWDVLVPLEFTEILDDGRQTFDRRYLPFNIFLQYLAGDNCSERSVIYLAQEQLLLNFPALGEYVPPPEYVKKAGKGDIYDVNIWMGFSGRTHTPLHKDPNPNLFVQLAGRKKIRLFPPEVGREMMNVYHRGGDISFRTGDEMMIGEHKDKINQVVWGNGLTHFEARGFEAEVRSGDGIFIPKGWWHAVNGIGGGVGNSVSVRFPTPRMTVS
jgi:mannose-6-phosphate isomerase-like protein (cupin superfamily)